MLPDIVYEIAAICGIAAFVLALVTLFLALRPRNSRPPPQPLPPHSLPASQQAPATRQIPPATVSPPDLARKGPPPPVMGLLVLLGLVAFVVLFFLLAASGVTFSSLTLPTLLGFVTILTGGAATVCVISTLMIRGRRPRHLEAIPWDGEPPNAH